MEKGYVSLGRSGSAASLTLEYSYDGWTVIFSYPRHLCLYSSECTRWGSSTLLDGDLAHS